MAFEGAKEEEEEIEDTGENGENGDTSGTGAERVLGKTREALPRAKYWDAAQVADRQDGN